MTVLHSACDGAAHCISKLHQSDPLVAGVLADRHCRLSSLPQPAVSSVDTRCKEQAVLPRGAQDSFWWLLCSVYAAQAFWVSGILMQSSVSWLLQMLLMHDTVLKADLPCFR